MESIRYPGHNYHYFTTDIHHSCFRLSTKPISYLHYSHPLVACPTLLAPHRQAMWCEAAPGYGRCGLRRRAAGM
jgi:hypothetical protein